MPLQSSTLTIDRSGWSQQPRKNSTALFGLALLRLHQLPGSIGHLAAQQTEAAGAGQHFAAVHVDHFAIDVACLIADQKRPQISNFLQRTEAVQRIVSRVELSPAPESAAGAKKLLQCG